MSNPFYLIWEDAAGALLSGYDAAWINGQLTFPITYPGITTEALALKLRSSAAANLTFESLVNVAFYLTGKDVPLVQQQWPYLLDSNGNATSQVTGGFEVSFNNGLTWNRFSNTVGLETNPSTWLALPQEAVGSVGLAGQINAFDAAHLLVRYVIPPSVNLTQMLDISLAVDCEIV